MAKITQVDTLLFKYNFNHKIIAEYNQPSVRLIVYESPKPIIRLNNKFLRIKGIHDESELYLVNQFALLNCNVQWKNLMFIKAIPQNVIYESTPHLLNDKYKYSCVLDYPLKPYNGQIHLFDACVHVHVNLLWDFLCIPYDDCLKEVKECLPIAADWLDDKLLNETDESVKWRVQAAINCLRGYLTCPIEIPEE